VEAPQETVMERMSRLIAEANMPPGALKAATEALQKVKDMEQSQQMGPEHQKTVAWLEWMVELPWSKSTAQEEGLDLGVARQRLDDDHYGLEKIKRRIVEYAAVRWLNPGAKGSILCLVGPPGVGKTSLGKSIAHTLGRAFHRVSLGGIRDEADVRGFNRTYVGSQPGRIIQAMRQAKSNDPVLLLDEIDKISMNSSNGNPSAALLEVLDPSQNTTFVDHYIGTPFDLSKIVFIATANSTDTIPGPLLDRMEVIRIPGKPDVPTKITSRTLALLPLVR
jgi:ATP-dependent Lon protease